MIRVRSKDRPYFPHNAELLFTDSEEQKEPHPARYKPGACAE